MNKNFKKDPNFKESILCSAKLKVPFYRFNKKYQVNSANLMVLVLVVLGYIFMNNILI